MCLAIPARVVRVLPQDAAAAPGPLGEVDLQGTRLEVSLAMVPEAQEGSWVLVHAGYAINLLDEEEARETWEWLESSGLAQESLTTSDRSGNGVPESDGVEESDHEA